MLLCHLQREARLVNLLRLYGEERDQLLITLSSALEKAPFVKAAWLFGSIGKGEADALSDIDLFVVVDDDAIQDIIAQPRNYVTQVGDPILYLEAPQNAPAGGAYAMACYDAPVAPHIVDWYWQPQSLAYIPGQVKLLFDRVELVQKDEPIQFRGGSTNKEIVERPYQYITFFWMMLMIVAKHAFRSPWAERMELLPFLIDPTVKAWRFLGQENIYPSQNVPSHRLPAEKLQLLHQFADRMNEMMSAISARGEEVPTGIVPGVYRYLKLVEGTIGYIR